MSVELLKVAPRRHGIEELLQLCGKDCRVLAGTLEQAAKQLVG